MRIAYRTLPMAVLASRYRGFFDFPDHQSAKTHRRNEPNCDKISNRMHAIATAFVPQVHFLGTALKQIMIFA
jgi:hypothetical protein